MSPRELAEGAVRTLLSELVVDLATLDDIAARVIDARIIETERRAHARACAYLALELHRYYSALETIFERVARQLDGRMPGGNDWHKALLTQAGLSIDELRPALVSREVAADLGALLSFRHFLRRDRIALLTRRLSA